MNILELSIASIPVVASIVGLWFKMNNLGRSPGYENHIASVRNKRNETTQRKARRKNCG